MADAPAPERTDLQPDALWDDWTQPPRIPDTPELHLDGYDGPLDLLLDLVERERLDLSCISVLAMVDQLVAAMARFEGHVKLERRADWLVLAARLLLLRSRLLLPGEAEAAQAAQEEGGLALDRLRTLQTARTAAAWLETQPRLGRDVFAAPQRGRDPRVVSYMRLMEACLAVLEREEAHEQPEAEAVYRPVIPALFRIPEALARMRRQLATLAEPKPLVAFLPLLPEKVDDRDLVARSAVSSTFVAALELARINEMVLGEDVSFERVTATSVLLSASGSGHQ